MKRLLVTALLASAAMAHAQTAASAAATSPAKKELVQRLLVLQQPGIEGMARNLVEQPALRMMQGAGQALQQVAPDKREAAGKAIEADIKKYVDDATPIVRDRAIKLAPSTIGAVLEEKFTEDELKQLIAWLESPVNKKYAQLGPEMQSSFTQKLVADARPMIEPRLQALDGKVRASLGVPAAAAAPASAPAPAKATAPKKAASK
jgi:hypothetical protein